MAASMSMQTVKRFVRHGLFTIKNLNNVNNKCIGIQKRALHASIVRQDAFNIQDADDFKEKVVKSTTPVIVDFHATWCGPCKLLSPRLESILDGYRGRLNFAKVDVDENTDLALEYGVNAVPVVLGIKNGKVVDQFVGLKDEDEIQSFFEKVLEN